MLPEGFTLGNSLEGISSLTESIRPPPCSVLSSLYGGENPSKMGMRQKNSKGMRRLTLFQILAEYQSYHLLLLLAFQICSVPN